MLKSIENLQAAASVSRRWLHIFGDPRHLESCKTAYKQYMAVMNAHRMFMSSAIVADGIGLRYST